MRCVKLFNIPVPTFGHKNESPFCTRLLSSASFQASRPTLTHKTQYRYVFTPSLRKNLTLRQVLDVEKYVPQNFPSSVDADADADAERNRLFVLFGDSCFEA